MTSKRGIVPWLQDADVTLYHGDVLATLHELPAESVDCVVTSPPYWGLRDYGAEGQLGLEPTPELFVERMVEVFREVRRVLAAHGTVWLNLGDSYGSGTMGRNDAESLGEYDRQVGHAVGAVDERVVRRAMNRGQSRPRLASLKPKDLVGIPWRVAFALQADGWYLRSDIIWSKPNPMPESVTDRPTKAHEYVFLLSKQPRYFFDQEAVREPHWHQQPEKQARYAAQIAQHLRRPPTMEGNGQTAAAKSGRGYRDDRLRENPSGRNIRSVWEIATQPYPEAHFATFPEELARRCIAAGCSEHGTVLDPFVGSGTVCYVARKLGRRSIGIDLNESYLELAARRLQQQSLFAEPAA